MHEIVLAKAIVYVVSHFVKQLLMDDCVSDLSFNQIKHRLYVKLRWVDIHTDCFCNVLKQYDYRFAS